MQGKITRQARAGLPVIGALLLGMGLALPALGQEGEDARKQLARKIREAVERTHSVRMERLRLREQHQADVAEVERQIQRLKDDLEGTNAELQEARKSVEALEARIEKAGGRKRAAERVLSEAARSAISAAKGMRKRVGAGIPYRRRERGEQLAGIVKALESPAPQSQADALMDYLSLSAEELRLAKAISLWNEPVLLDDGRRQEHAYQVRLGLVSHFFVSENGRTIGLAAKETGREWRLELDRVEQQQLRAVMDLLQERRPPEVIPVPFVMPVPPEKD